MHTSTRPAPQPIYLHNEPLPPRVAPVPARNAAAMQTTARIARPEPDGGARQATTRIIRRTEFRGVGDEARGSRLRARWFAAAIGGALPIALQAVVFRRELVAAWAAFAAEAPTSVALCQQAAVAGSIVLGTWLILALIAALQDRSDGRALQLGLASCAALSLVIGLCRVGGVMPAARIPALAFGQAIASPFALGVIDARARLRDGAAEVDAIRARADEAATALAAERAARAEDATRAAADREAALAKANAAADAFATARDDALAAVATARDDAAAARGEALTARAEAERALAALAAAKAPSDALAAERDRAVATAAAAERALAAKGCEIERLNAELERARLAASVEVSAAPVAAPISAPTAGRRSR